VSVEIAVDVAAAATQNDAGRHRFEPVLDVIQPHGMSDDLGGKPVLVVGWGMVVINAASPTSGWSVRHG